MSWLDRIKSAIVQPAPEPVAAVAARPDPRGAPGTRIHHEYFVADEPTNGRWEWLARVYAADSTPHQMTGIEDSPELAGAAALSWAESTKATMRGAA